MRGWEFIGATIISDKGVRTAGGGAKYLFAYAIICQVFQFNKGLGALWVLRVSSPAVLLCISSA